MKAIATSGLLIFLLATSVYVARADDNESSVTEDESYSLLGSDANSVLAQNELEERVEALYKKPKPPPPPPRPKPPPKYKPPPPPPRPKPPPKYKPPPPPPRPKPPPKYKPPPPPPRPPRSHKRSPPPPPRRSPSPRRSPPPPPRRSPPPPSRRSPPPPPRRSPPPPPRRSPPPPPRRSPPPPPRRSPPPPPRRSPPPPPPPRRSPPPPPRRSPPPPPRRSPPPPPRRSPPPPRRSPPPPRRSPPPPPRRSPPPPPRRSPPPPPRRSPPPPPRRSPPPTTSSNIYRTALSSSYLFYEAQVSGTKPSWNRISFRGDSMTSDFIPGGWYDAGDTLKLNLPLAHTVTYLAWSVLDYGEAYDSIGARTIAMNNVRWAAQFLMDCHTDDHEYVGQIGNPGVDHSYWGRPEDETGSRPYYTWDRTTPASDLLGAVSAALTSTSLLFEDSSSSFSDELLEHAIQLYEWGKAYPGRYSSSYTSVTYVYSSSRYIDKLMYAAAWLYRATGQSKYADDAYTFWQSAGSGDIYAGWDSSYAPAINLLLKMYSEGKTVPGRASYEAWWTGSFQQSWRNANGDWSIVKTVQGLAYPSWSQWGNLRYSSNAAYMMLVRASYSSTDRATNVAWAKNQLDYALSKTGRSFVVGVGNNYPRQPHHRAASCPDEPAPCDWDQYYTASPNPQILYGALVGGPPNGDSTYEDLRSNYVTNEVAVDYNAGFTGALAAYITLS